MSDGYAVPPTQPAPAAVAPALVPSTGAAVPLVETLAAQPNFTTAAQTDLSKAQVAIDAVDTNKLYLDKGSARALIKAIATARDNVEALYKDVSGNLDIELQFGDNWVGRTISSRLRTVAVGDEESAVSVVGKFLEVLSEVEHTVREASGVADQADEDAKDAFKKIDGGKS
jgi:hypothetical protein